MQCTLEHVGSNTIDTVRAVAHAYNIPKPCFAPLFKEISNALMPITDNNI